MKKVLTAGSLLVLMTGAAAAAEIPRVNFSALPPPAGHRTACEAYDGPADIAKETRWPSRVENCPVDRAIVSSDVVLLFDADPAGRPESIQAEGAPLHCLERAAKSALEAWRYCPPSELGEPQRIYGLRATFRFRED